MFSTEKCLAVRVFRCFNPLNPPYQGDFKRKCVSPIKANSEIGRRDETDSGLVNCGEPTGSERGKINSGVLASFSGRVELIRAITSSWDADVFLGYDPDYTLRLDMSLTCKESILKTHPIIFGEVIHHNLINFYVYNIQSS